MNAQRFIETDQSARLVNPVAAALARKHMLNLVIDNLESVQRMLIAKGTKNSNFSNPYNKAKLRAYYTCKQQDKVKCRAAIDAFKELATEVLQRIMDGDEDGSFYMYGAQEAYYGDFDKDETVRQMANSMKNTVEVLEYMYNDM